MTKEKAKELYKQGCNAYLQLFCEKHDFDFEDAKESWISNDVGSIVACGDYFVGMQDIITDIELDAPENAFLEWYDYCIEAHYLEVPTPNFESFLKGCSRIPKESIDRIKKLKQEFINVVNEEKKKINQ